MRSRLHSVWMLYNKCLNTRPLITKSITSGCIALSADVICQLSFPSIKYNYDSSDNSISCHDNHVDKLNEVADIDKDDEDVKIKMNKEIVTVTSYESFNWRRMINFATMGK